MWAQVVLDAEAMTLLPWICRRQGVGSSVCSDPWTSDTGLAAKGKSVAGKNHAGGYSDGRGKQINGLAGVGGYLNRGRSAKGGIGQERFPLDLAEYVERDNHRNGTTETQNTDYETIGEATHLVNALGLYPQLILLTRHTTRPSMVQLKPPLHPETWIPFQLSRDVEIT